jgi:hypothetical protein
MRIKSGKKGRRSSIFKSPSVSSRKAMAFFTLPSVVAWGWEWGGGAGTIGVAHRPHLKNVREQRVVPPIGRASGRVHAGGRDDPGGVVGPIAVRGGVEVCWEISLRALC